MENAAEAIKKKNQQQKTDLKILFFKETINEIANSLLCPKISKETM